MTPKVALFHKHVYTHTPYPNLHRTCGLSLCMFMAVIFSVTLYLRNDSSNLPGGTKIPLSTFWAMLYLSISPLRISVLTILCLFPGLLPLPVATTWEALEWRECFLPDVEHQAQGALLTGTAGFLEIAKNSTMRHSLIHRLHSGLTHSLLQRFVHSNFNYIMDSLFSALIYSLPAILVYHVSDRAGSPLRAYVKFQDSGNRMRVHHVFLQLVCADTPGLVKYTCRKNT